MLLVLTRDYSYTVTDSPDDDLLKYLRRRANIAVTTRPPTDAHRLDISLDDEDGDVVAGLSGYTHAHRLYLEVVWVHASLRGDGLGTQLIRMAEDLALKRGCQRAQVHHTYAPTFYQKQGYQVTGQMHDLAHNAGFYWLEKPLTHDHIQKDTA